MIEKQDWKWFGTAGHLCVSSHCQFHLATQVGPWLVSTVGDYWPERAVREIHARIHDPTWFAENKHLLGDYFDAAYMERFGFTEVGYKRLFETMVFIAGAPCTSDECSKGGCGMPSITPARERFAASYNDRGEAQRGHMAMCEKVAAITLEQYKSEHPEEFSDAETD